MNVFDLLANKRDSLSGEYLSPIDRRRLSDEFPNLLSNHWITELMSEFPIINMEFELAEVHDLSGLGVEMKWLSANAIIEEGKQAYPGIIATNLGFVPVGSCLLGSGDPYFINTMTGEFVRIPHDSVIEDSLRQSSIELVSESLTDFFRFVL